MLDNEELGYWRRAVASTFLNCGSDVRKVVSDGIAVRLKPDTPPIYDLSSRSRILRTSR